MSDGKGEHEIDRRITTVLRALCLSVVVKRELCPQTRLTVYTSVYLPILTYGHECWVMTKRTGLQVQATEMRLLRGVAGLTFRDRVRSSVIQENLGVESLLLRIKRSQFRWFGHQVRMPPRRLPVQLYRAHPTERRPRGRLRTHWKDYISRLGWERLGIP